MSAFFKFYRPISWIVQNRLFFFDEKVQGGGSGKQMLHVTTNTLIIFIETYIVRVIRYIIQARKQASAGCPSYHIQASSYL